VNPKLMLTHLLSIVTGALIGIGGTIYVLQQSEVEPELPLPFSLSSQSLNGQKSLNFSFTETTTIKSLVVNEGHCPVLNWNEEPMVFPHKFVIGSTFRPKLDCRLNVVRVSVETDRGVFISTF